MIETNKIYACDENKELTLSFSEAMRSAKMLVISQIKLGGMGEGSEKYIGSEAEEATFDALSRLADRLQAEVNTEETCNTFDECMLFGKIKPTKKTDRRK